jgi:PII-like signaling protein
VKLEGERTLLRVHLRNTDKFGLARATDVLVGKARSAGLAGATVLRGILGLDVRGQLLESAAWSLVEHVPVVVEFVDSPQAIGRFLAELDAIIPEGIATLEQVHVLVYRHERGTAGLRRDIPGPITAGAALPPNEEFPIMKLSETGQLLRIFIGESDDWHGTPLYRAIVLKAKELGLAGATVLRGPMGFGANSRVHTANLLELSTDLPIVIEIVDSAEKVQTLLPFLDETVAEGMITLESVRVLRYVANRER